MKKKVMILSLAFLICCGTSHAADKNRIRASFDQGWTFRLCKSHADATEVIRQLGVANPGLSLNQPTAKKTKVTDDTEPEQAQVTASEVTTSKASQASSDKNFRPVTIPHDASNCPSIQRWEVRLVISPAVKASTARISRSLRNGKSE